jgi:hypothetical protein
MHREISNPRQHVHVKLFSKWEKKISPCYSFAARQELTENNSIPLKIEVYFGAMFCDFCRIAFGRRCVFLALVEGSVMAYSWLSQWGTVRPAECEFIVRQSEGACFVADVK